MQSSTGPPEDPAAPGEEMQEADLAAAEEAVTDADAATAAVEMEAAMHPFLCLSLMQEIS